MSKKCRRHECQMGCDRYAGFNACTTLPALLVLCQSGLLANDRSYILILLCLCCGGFGAGGCGCGLFGNSGC